MSDYTEQIDTVFISVLEKLAFMFAEAVPKEEVPTDIDTLIQTDIRFTGHASGHISLIVRRDICGELVSNILGSDPDETEGAESEDALGELLNVVCGQLLTTISGDQPVFDLSAPATSRPDIQKWQAFLKDSGTRSYVIDETPILLNFSMAA